MNSVNRTLYIPLYGKAYVSRKGIILRDEKAEAIWAAEGFALKGKSSSKWLAYYMGMRAAVFDRWLREKLEQDPGAVVLHIGCGLDSRVERVGARGRMWFDLDLPEVIKERRRYYRETDGCKMIGADVTDAHWIGDLPGGNAIVVMEGVSMYLQSRERIRLFERLLEHFGRVSVLMDCYCGLAARASRVKNPINDVGVTQVYGMDDPREPERTGGLTFLREHSMTPQDLTSQLEGMERAIFRAVYAGRIAKRLYRLYEYRGESK